MHQSHIHEELFEAPWSDDGTLLSTIEHELGHALGFTGWVWDDLGLVGLSSRGTSHRDTYFSGRRARAAFSGAGGQSLPGQQGPRRERSGPGQRGQPLAPDGLW